MPSFTNFFNPLKKLSQAVRGNLPSSSISLLLLASQFECANADQARENGRIPMFNTVGDVGEAFVNLFLMCVVIKGLYDCLNYKIPRNPDYRP